MDLSIIIVNWNSKDYLRNCLQSILAGSLELDFEIVVIDSASFDGCAEMLSSEFPRVRFLQSDENLGFARANNRAFEASSGKTVLFLNPDAVVVGPAIQVLHSVLVGTPGAGAVGARLLNSDGSLQTSCVQAFPTILNQVLSAELLRRLTPHAGLWGASAILRDDVKVAEVDMISGACLMMRRSVFERIGRFSPDYFMYAEDVDLCYKARESGFSNFYVPEAVVVHHGGGSSQQARSNFSSVMMVESISRFLIKFHGRAYGNCYRVALSAAALVRVGILILLFPCLWIRTGSAKWSRAVSKWVAVFRWGLGSSMGNGGGANPEQASPA